MFKLARFVFGVRRELRAYQDYIKAIDVGLQIMSDECEELRADLDTVTEERDNYRAGSKALRDEVKRLNRYIDGLHDQIDELEGEVQDLESEVEDLEDTYGEDDDDTPWDEPVIAHELVAVLKEAGLDPLRTYSVGELLDIRNALQGVRIA